MRVVYTVTLYNSINCRLYHLCCFLYVRYISYHHTQQQRVPGTRRVQPNIAQSQRTTPHTGGNSMPRVANANPLRASVPTSYPDEKNTIAKLIINFKKREEIIIDLINFDNF